MKRCGQCLAAAAVALCLAPGMTHAVETATDPLVLEMERACRALEPSNPLQKPGRLQDLEIVFAALGFEAMGDPDEANAFRQYLLDYYEKSPLVKILPPVPADSGLLSDYDPGPAYSRLVRALYTDLTAHREQTRLEPLGEVLKTQMQERDGDCFADFIRSRPDSQYAGWFAYQMAWHQAVAANSAEPLAAFSRACPGHPLAQEARQALDMQFFSPRRLAQLSGLLPGSGEEILEPGLRESSSFMYSELVYVLGTIGFVVASQVGSRTENLTGALIMANLLMLNHRASSENAFVLATRRNQATARKFLQDRMGQPVRAPGPVRVPEAPREPLPPMADQLLFSLELPLSDMLSDFRGRGWVRDEQLTNLGIRLSYVRSLLDLNRAPDWESSLGLAPWGRYYANRAQRLDDSPLAADAEALLAGAGLEGLFLLRLNMGGSWIQLRLSGGPGWRMRQTGVGDQRLNGSGWVATATAGLELGGFSETFWHLGYTLEDAGRAESLRLAPGEVAIPGQRQGLEFGLGIRF